MDKLDLKPKQCDTRPPPQTTRIASSYQHRAGSKLSRMLSQKELNIIKIYISVNIFIISFSTSVSRTFMVDCLKSRYGSFTVISAKPCQNALGQVGTCMFMWDCIKSEGLHLGTCSDRFLFGSCCYHNSTSNDIDIQRPNTTTSQTTTDGRPMAISNSVFSSSGSSSSGSGSSSSGSSGSSSSSISSSSASSSTPTTSPPTTFIQSTSSLSGHLNSIISQNQQSTAINTTRDDQAKPELYRPANISNNVKSPYPHYEGPIWPPQEQPQNNSSVNKLSQSTMPQPAPTTTTTTTPAPQTMPFSQDSTPSHIAGSFMQSHNSQSSEQVIPTVTQLSVSRPTTSLPIIMQNTDQFSTTAPTQKPQGLWLGSIVSSFFPSFKPFPFPNPNRPRPTSYRPFMAGLRPSHYRPFPLSPPKPTNPIANQQQMPAQVTDVVGSSSENSFSNSTLASSSNSLAPPPSPPDKKDHDVVNVSSSFMTERDRPVDKSPVNPFAQGVNMNQPHYEVINGTSLVVNKNQFNTSVPYDSNDAVQNNPTTQYGTLANFETSDHTTTFPNYSNSSMQASVTPVISDGANNYDGLVTPTYSSYEPPKPANVLLEQPQHNESVNYPSYPVIPSFPSLNMSPPPPPFGHFSTNGPIDEIPGLYVPPKDNSSAPLATEDYNPQLQTPFDTAFVDPNLNDDRRKPIQFDQIFKPLTTSGSQLTDSMIGDSDPPRPQTIAMSFSSTPPVDPTTLQEVATLPPPTSTLPPKPFSAVNEGGVKKGNGKEATCGVTTAYPQTKVVGGKNAAFGAWPWQVSVRKVSFFGFSSTHRCGGAVISSEWIATAGHCVEDLALQSIRIRVGEYDFSSMAEPFPYIERAARRKVVHPKYNFYTYENDLALVQLDQPIQFPPHVAPICLPPDNIDLLGRNATVTGWGRLNEGGTLPTILQEVRVPIVSNDKCKDMFLRAGRPEYIPDIFLCAGYEEGGRDSCQGDSGGPLQVKGDDGRWFLAGIISWGIGCAEQNLPGVCTRISRFKLWIQSTMNSAS